MNSLKRVTVLASVLLITFGISGCGGNESSTAGENSNDEPAFSADLQVIGDLSHLAGKLVFIEQRAQPNFRIAQLDFATGEVSTLFAVPQNGWIYEVTATADGRLIFSYSPPDVEGEPQLDRSRLYLLDLNTQNAAPEALIAPSAPETYHAFPLPINDDMQLLYSRLAPSSSDNGRQAITLMAYDFETGNSVELIPQAILPSTSGLPEANRLAYIHINGVSQARSIFATRLDTLNEEVLVSESQFYDLGTPLISPDGQWIYFVALESPIDAVSAPNIILDLLLGQPVLAHANHNLPSDWWRISRGGDIMQQVTELSMIIYDGAFSPDGQSLIFSTEEGIYVMSESADHAEPELLVRSRAIRDIYWIE